MDREQSDAQRNGETKRRRRELIAIGVAGLALVGFAFTQTRLPPLSHHTSLASNLAVILLFDLSFLLLGLLLFLVGRNVAKVIFERRRGLIGSKLQARLVFGFVAVALLPSAFLLYVSESFLRADIDSWFDPEYERVLDDSLEIAKIYYLNSANDALHYARVLAQQIAERNLLQASNRAELKKLVEKSQQEYKLGTIEVFSANHDLLLIALSPQIPTGIGVSPHSALLEATLSGHPSSRTDSLGSADIIRGSAPIYAGSDSDTVTGAIVIDYYVPKSLAKKAANISRTFEEFLQLRTLKQPILHSYIIGLLLIGLVVVLLASWFGIYLARGIIGPIKLLAQGTDAVAAGDLEYEIAQLGDDEIGHLVASFNRMTVDLRASHAELEQRRRYMETVLRNVSGGVAALDREGTVVTINPSAERMLGVSAAATVGRPYALAFAPAVTERLEELFGAGPHPAEVRASIRLAERGDSELLLTATALSEEAGVRLGTVLFFEDVSQIAKIERMEAWREVARRIAHEIKNPLTPILLSAERIRRHMHGQLEPSRPIIDECTRTISSEVEDLKRLVDEFSSFARMPHLNPVPGDLNALVQETGEHFANAHPELDLTMKLDWQVPKIGIDRDGLKRALVNLLDNAAGAVKSCVNGERPQVEMRTALDDSSGVVTLEVCDNGPGIDPRLRARIFEPYFSTKEGGTGLGLAIVSTIINDHHGFVRVRDNKPHGSRFILEFPVKEKEYARAFG